MALVTGPEPSTPSESQKSVACNVRGLANFTTISPTGETVMENVETVRGTASACRS